MLHKHPIHHCVRESCAVVPTAQPFAPLTVLYASCAMQRAATRARAPVRRPTRHTRVTCTRRRRPPTPHRSRASTAGCRPTRRSPTSRQVGAALPDVPRPAAGWVDGADTRGWGSSQVRRYGRHVTATLPRPKAKLSSLHQTAGQTVSRQRSGILATLSWERRYC